MGCGLSSEAASAIPDPTNPDEALEFALQNANKEALQRALDTHANVNKTFTDRQGLEYTPMHIVAKMGCPELINKLSKAGGDVMRLDGRGDSPLHIAARHDKGDGVTALVAIGADLEMLNKDKLTPLAVAISNNSSDALAKLIEAGADVNGRDDLEAPLIIAAKVDNVDAVVALLQSAKKTACRGGRNLSAVGVVRPAGSSSSSSRECKHGSRRPAPPRPATGSP